MRILIPGADWVIVRRPSLWKSGLGRLWKRLGKFLRRFFNMSSQCERLQQSAHHRVGHVSVNYNNLILIWGGYATEGYSSPDQQYYPSDEILTFKPSTGTWSRLKTSRVNCPAACSGATGQAVHDSLFVICGFFNGPNGQRNANSVFVLNLKTLTWERRFPSGPAPLACDKLSSWAHGSKVYIFGGFGPKPERNPWTDGRGFSHVLDEVNGFDQRGWCNQCAAYNVTTDAWEWPKFKGNLPCERAAHATIVNGDDVYLFGGRHKEERMNDLYRLDLQRMVWSLIHPCVRNYVKTTPEGRSWHSLTLVGPDRALLYGGYTSGDQPLGDCWLLQLSKNPAEIQWTRWRDRETGSRLWHTANYSESTSTVLGFGGVITDLLDRDEDVRHPEGCLSILAHPRSLDEASLRVVLKHYDRFKAELPTIPVALKELISVRHENPLLLHEEFD